MKRLSYLFFCFTVFYSVHTVAQHSAFSRSGHSHNDYRQPQPLYTAYAAGMGSIEADVFLKNGQLYVAHDSTEIKIGLTLKKLYLEPLARIYSRNGSHAFLDSGKTLQLVIDIKEAHAQVLVQLIKELKTFNNTFNFSKNRQAIRIVISGDLPPPVDFKKYPAFLAFDGRPDVVYNDKQLERIAMISADFKKYSKWKGIGKIPAAEEMIIKSTILAAHEKGKPFRFWGTPDFQTSWKVMEGLGVDWVNTDVPQQLQAYFLAP